jgi:alkyl hydroperoxide reductase subunit AhpC
VIALSVDPVESHKKWIEDIDSSQDSLQLTDNYSVATPGNWKHGNDVVILPSVQDPEVIKQKFPKGYVAVRPYLRITPQPNWHDHDEISRSG